MNSETISITWQGDSALRCIARRQETPDTFSFDLVAEDGRSFDFLPGQFVLIGVDIEGQTLWRAYSISSSPSHAQSITITVKQLAGGRVSSWLCSTLTPGMLLSALPPNGSFVLSPQALLPRSVALLSAGCGITPVMSMLRWLLENRPEIEVHFIHSARDETHLIFADELQELAARHPQLRLHFFLSRGHGQRTCHTGRLDATRLAALLPANGELKTFICGTDAYVTQVTGWLSAQGHPSANIAQESFTPGSRPDETPGEAFRLRVPEFARDIDIAGHEWLLDALEREKLPIIGACRSGICGACKCQVVHGEVTTNGGTVLSPQELADGYVLACSTQARSDLTLALG